MTLYPSGDEDFRKRSIREMLKKRGGEEVRAAEEVRN